jgi:hypothetical protein
MDVIINFRSPMECSRLDIEDDIEAILGPRAEVAGGGSFLDGSGANIDLEVVDEAPEAVAGLVADLRALLARRLVPADTVITVHYDDDRAEDHAVYTEEERASLVEERDRQRRRQRSQRRGKAPAGRRRTRRATSPARFQGRVVEVGDTFLVPLRQDLCNICRIIKFEPRADSHQFMVGATCWYGSTPPADLSDPRIHALLNLSFTGSPDYWRIAWVDGAPPKGSQYLGVVPPSPEEQQLVAHLNCSWQSFLPSVLREWRWQHEREALLADDEAERARVARLSEEDVDSE